MFGLARPSHMLIAEHLECLRAYQTINFAFYWEHLIFICLLLLISLRDENAKSTFS